MKKAARNKVSFFENVEESVEEQVTEIAKDKKNILHVLVQKTSTRSGKIILFIVIVIAVISATYLYVTYQNSKDLASTNGKLSADQVKILISEVADKIEVPKGETPTIATVTDVTKLANQTFFKNAKNGDKVMVYGSIHEAILYRVDIHKIIAVAPINQALDQNQQANSQATPTTSVTPGASVAPTKAVGRLKVVILNSTKTAGLAKKAAALMDPVKADIKTSNAVGEYDKTTVSSVAKDKIPNIDLASLVAGYTKIKPSVVTLPKAEVVPDGADVVIILGKDFASSY